MKADGITFRPDDLPNDVFGQIRAAGGTRWHELDEETRKRGVGKLRLAGVYDDRQEPHFMLRTRIPGGVLSADQLEAIAGVVRDFAVKPAGEDADTPERFGEITTRQDVQIHWIGFEDLPEIWDRYDRVGISTSHSCGDTLRNVTACPVTGVDPSSLIDTRPIMDALGRFTFGEPELTARLPRKFKVVVTGCPTDCTVARINDLVFTPALRNSVIGFNVHVGGGLSDSPRMASALDLFVTTEQVVDTARATLEAFVAHGDFQDKAVNRFRIVVHELGAERVEEEIRARLGFDAPGAGEDLSSWRAEDHIGVQVDAAGTHYVGLNVPLGRLSDVELFEVARLARVHGDGGVRLTQRQNLVLTGVADPNALLAEELVAARLSPEPDPFERAVVACTSAPFCKFAILNVKEYGALLIEHLRAEVPNEVWPSLQGLRLHVSGCKASCAQIQTAHIGLRATMTKDEETYHDAFDVALGGDVGAGRLGGWAALEVPAEAAFDRIAGALATIDGHGLDELEWDEEREER